MHLYETHLAVADTAISQAFYTEVVGLEFAHRDLSVIAVTGFFGQFLHAGSELTLS